MNKYYKLYTDGSNLSYIKLAGFGGYALDPEGTELFNFSEIVSNPDLNTKHEILAIEAGLKKCISEGVEYLRCYSDEQQICAICNIPDNEFRKHYLSNNPLLENIFNLLPFFKDIQFNYIPRKENKLADKLSRKAIQEHLESPLYAAKVAKGFYCPNLYYQEMYTTKEGKENFRHIKSQSNVFFSFEFISAEKESTILFKQIIKDDSTFKIIKEDNATIPTRNWMAHCLNFITKQIVESETEESRISITFVGGQATKLDKYLRNYDVPSQKLAQPLELFKESIFKFEQVILNNYSQIKDFIYPDTKKLDPFNPNNKAYLLEAIKVLGHSDYQLGQNKDIEQLYATELKTRKDDVVEIQKKLFGEFLKISIKEENSKNSAMAKRNPKEVLQIVLKIREQIESQGVNLKFKN